MDEGRAFEDQVIVPALVEALVEALDRPAVFVAYGDHVLDKQRRIDETLAAMEARAPAIVGGQLPDDTAGGRTGSPDVLVRVTVDFMSASYVPVDIKHHTTLKRAPKGNATATRLRSLGGFALGGVPTAPGWSYMTSHRFEDAMQLAHYTRLLQAIDRHPGTNEQSDVYLGGIIGTSDFTEITGERYGVVWHDLKALTEKTRSNTAATGWVKRSVLHVYDHEFAFRQKVATAARDGETLVVPFGKAECNQCPYEEWCTTEAGDQDASFAIKVGRLTDREWRYLYDNGLSTIEALAEARPTGALLDGFVRQAAHLPTPERRLTTAIRRARMTRDAVLLERTTHDALDVPAADVEIDFDVEWHPADGHVYQWGARVRQGQDEATSTYEHSVLSFDTLDDASAQALANKFFDWLERFVADHEEAGRTVRIFHWTSPEVTKTIRALGGDRAEALFERFLDLRRWMDDRYFARDGFSLKVVAPIFGFRWRSGDAGGEMSVLKVEEARDDTNPQASKAARDWLLEYNEDDCAAQAVIRDGLRHYAEEDRITEAHRLPAPVYAPSNDGSVKQASPKSTAEQNAPISTPSRTDIGWGHALTAGTKGLSLNEIRTRIAKFVVDYKDVKTEKQHTGDFWKAFMRCYGVEDSFLHGVTFEYPARRSDTGGTGYIDVFMPGQYLIEQKTDGKISRPKSGGDSNAEQQASAYLTGGTITQAQMPRWVITSDFTTIQVTDLTVPRQSPTRTKTILTADLIDHVEMFLFLTGDDAGALIAEEQAEASIKAARLMGDLYAAMTGDADTDTLPDDPEEEDDATMEASILLTRLLFLMFGDDAGLWQRGQFQSFIEKRTALDGTDLGPQLAALFNVLDTPEPRDKRLDEALAEFPYVNGALFRHDDTKMMWFDKGMRDALLSACNFDWSRISPAVFGSLFQTVKSKAARRSEGEHYTSEANILKILGPMFLDDLRARLEAANTKPALEALHEELKSFRFVDPACGCGNFLIVAYREMRALELDLLVKLQAKRGRDMDLIMDPSDMLNVRLDQFYGIELSWWPAKIAETAMFLVDHQANQRMAKVLGLTPRRLPIDIAANIHHANALTSDWDTLLPGRGVTTFMFGNPPFLGDTTRNAQQLSELQAAWGPSKQLSRMDFVTGWHAKALRYFSGKTGEFAFVTTNSIVQGDQVHRLFNPIYDAGWHIKFAHRTFAWDSESASKDKAAVHCVIVGFTRDPRSKSRLFDYPVLRGTPREVPVKRVNSYLVEGPDVTIEKRQRPLNRDLPEVNYGSKPTDGGHFFIAAEDYDTVMADPVAAKYVRKFVGASELIRNIDRWCLWLKDLDSTDVPKSPVLKERIAAVRDFRAASTAESTRAFSHHHLFRQLGQPDVPYLGIPRHVSENRLYFPAARFSPDVICGDANFLCPDPDGFGFAIISSSMFITWQKTVGGRLESRLRFSKDIVWNNLPLPALTGDTRQRIITAGQGVLAARALHPNRSLADHYQPLGMDPALVDAHRALDRVVDKAFGASKGVQTEATRQATLFTRYQELTAGLGS